MIWTRGTVVGICVGLVVTLFLNSAALAAAGLNNLALIELVKAPACDPDWPVCAYLPRSQLYPPHLWTGNTAAVQHVAHLLGGAVSLAPGAVNIRLRLAEVQFALGKRDAAASTLATVSAPPAPSALLCNDRYEHQLTLARQYAQAGRWAEAVQAYRLGLAYGTERTLLVDERDFFLASAEMHRQRAANDPRAIYLTGKYLARAGEWAEAVPWLRRAVKVSTLLSADERGWIYAYVGQALEAQGDGIGAADAYKQGIEVAPTLAENYARLLRLLRQQGDSSAAYIETRLSSLEPAYILGKRGIDYRTDGPVQLPSGWTLIGYEVDEESLEAGAPIDLLLWWKAPSGAQLADDGWARAADCWLQWQHVTNLAPNAGFEWSGPIGGLPPGYANEFYGAPFGSVSVVRAMRDGRQTSVLRLDNSQSWSVGLRAVAAPVEPDAFYLMAGWRRSQGGSGGNIGWLCRVAGLGDPPFYIAYYRGNEPTSGVHFATLSHPFPEHETHRCDVFLLSGFPGGWGDFDNLLFAQIQVP